MECAASVVSFQQGPAANPAGVAPPDISDPTKALGGPSASPDQGASLGIGGPITLKFDEPLVNVGGKVDFAIFNSNSKQYTACAQHPQRAEVFVSLDGVSVVSLGIDC